MEYREIAVYLKGKYLGRFDNKERLDMVVSNILHNNWEDGEGEIDPFDFSFEERIGKVFDFK